MSIEISTMTFEGRMLDHLRLALRSELRSPAETIMEGPEPAELTRALRCLDDVRAVLEQTGFDGDEPTSVDLDLEQSGEIVLHALLAHAAGERDRISDEFITPHFDEATFDETQLVTIVWEYSEIKKAIAELKARGLGIGPEAAIAAEGVA